MTLGLAVWQRREHEDFGVAADVGVFDFGPCGVREHVVSPALCRSILRDIDICCHGDFLLVSSCGNLVEYY